MTEPTLTEKAWALGQLAGQEKVELPVTIAGRELLMMKMIQEALQRGVSWRSIGYVLVGKPDGKLAKKAAKQLARQCQRNLLIREISERRDDANA